MKKTNGFLFFALIFAAFGLWAKGTSLSSVDNRLALKSMVAGVLSSDTNVIAVGDAVYTVTVTAKGPVATEKQVVKPSQLVALSSSTNEQVHYAKLATRRYKGALCYTNDGRGRPRQSYAVAWDATRKEPLSLIRMEMFNVLDLPGAVAASVVDPALKNVQAIDLSSSCLMADNVMLPYMALATGSAMPYTYLDGWGAFGAKGENFDGGFGMAWISRNALDLIRSLLGEGSIGLALSNPEGLKAQLLEKADLKGAFSAACSLVNDGFGFGIAGGVGLGKVALDRKSELHTISSLSGGSFVFDMDTTYVPYEVWNIYNGRSLTHMMEEYNAYYCERWDMQRLQYTRDASEADFDYKPGEFVVNPTAFGYSLGPIPWPYNSFPEMLKLCEKAVDIRVFRGYGTFSVKYSKAASKKLTKTTDPAERVAAFLKAAKAPKYVTAADVMDCRANYLAYMFNGRTKGCASFELPGWTEDELAVSPMTAANAITETARMIQLFEDGCNTFEIAADEGGSPVFRLVLFGREHDLAVEAQDFGWTALTPVRAVGLDAIAAALEAAAVKAESSVQPGAKTRGWDYRSLRLALEGACLTLRDGILPLRAAAFEARERGIR